MTNQSTPPNIEPHTTLQGSGAEQTLGRSAIGVIIAIGASICLIILTCGAVYLVAKGQDIGSFESLDKLKKGSGIVGIFVVLYAIFRLIVNPADKSDINEKKTLKSKNVLPLIASVVMSFSSAFVASGLQDVVAQKKSLTQEVLVLRKEVGELKAVRVDLLSFLGELSKRENIALLHNSVNALDWQQAVSEVEQMPNGQRKMAVLRAILLAWKSIPFKLVVDSKFSDGVNSPAFFRHLLSTVGIDVSKSNQQRDSEALRVATDPVESPMPGDLMFFRGAAPGSTGEYVMMYIGKSQRGGHGICLGVMGTNYPLQIVDAYWLEEKPSADQFRGYRRPSYL